jgi:c-di-GMP-binding flagellar brake protein YcgR
MASGFDTADIFARAARERALTVVSVQDGENWTQFKSRFLERDPARRFFVLDHVFDNDTPPPPIANGQYVGVSLRQSSRKFLFSTIVEAKGQFVFDSNTAVPALRYRWPDHVTELQRRVYYRTPVPADAPPIPARLWRGGIAARAHQNPALQMLSGTVVNLSCGGAQIAIDSSARTDWAEDDLLGIELNLGDGRPPVAVDARFRGARNDERSGASIAVQFMGLELGPDGRQALQRLAYTVQRLHRLNAAIGGESTKEW